MKTFFFFTFFQFKVPHSKINYSVVITGVDVDEDYQIQENDVTNHFTSIYIFWVKDQEVEANTFLV